MLVVFLIVFSGVLVWLSTKYIGEILIYKKYLVNIEHKLQNFFLIFCVILIINIVSWLIIKALCKVSTNQEIINFVFHF